MAHSGNRYLLFYKPYDVLTQFSDRSVDHPRPTLKDFVDVSNVYAAGRLDKDSEGLLLLTDDGILQHRLTDPAFAHPRTYWVQVERMPNAIALERLQQGISIQGYQTRPAQARLIKEPDLPPRHPPIRFRKTVPTAWLELTLTEGRNRQVRRMTAAIGHPTLRLVRIAIAHLTIDGLAPGEWRELNGQDISALKRLGSKRPGRSFSAKPPRSPRHRFP